MRLLPRLDRLALCLLACLAFLPSLGGGFVYDDVPLVQEDPRVQSGDLVGALTQPYWGDRHGGLYRPVTTLSFVLGGLVTQAPWFYRATNLALHAGAALLAYALARRLLGARAPALFAAALFAVHPIHVEVAANGVGRAESLAFLLAGGAWLVVLDDEHRVRARRLLPSALLAALGVLAKESALVLALAAPLEVLLLAPKPRARGVALACVPAAAALALALGARVAVLGPALLTPTAVAAQQNPFAGTALGVRLANAPLLLLFYVRNLVFPVALSPDYGGALPLVEHALAPAAFGWWAAALVVLALPALAGRRALFASLFVLLTLAPALQLVPIGTLAGDRLAYTAAFGLVLDLGLLLAAAARRFRGRTWAPLAALLLGWFTLTSAADARAWADPVRLFERARTRTPQSAQVAYALGALRVRRGEDALARQPLEAAAALSPADGNIRLLLGQVQEALGHLAEARGLYEDALALGVWDESKARVQLGLVLLRLGEREAAERAFARAAELAPRDGDILLRLAQVRRDLGHREEARELYRRGLALGALDEAKGRAQLGMLLAELGDLPGAEQELRRVTELQPGVGLWFLALGQVLEQRGDGRGARAAFEHGLELDPKNPQADEIRRALATLPR